MPGPRQPINVVLMNGRKHLTQEEIRTRKEQEVKAKADNIHAPSYLTKKLKDEFEQIAIELKRIDLMSNLDVDALARFLLAREQYIKLSKQLRNTPVMVEEQDESGLTVMVMNRNYSKLLSAVDKLFAQCRAASMDLGLTISSRCKLIVPKKEDKPKTAEELMFGDAL